MILSYPDDLKKKGKPIELALSVGSYSDLSRYKVTINKICNKI